MELSLAKKFVDQSFISKRKSDVFFNSVTSRIKKLNKDAHKMAVKNYEVLIDRLNIDGQLIIPSMDNFELLSAFMPQFDMLINRYRLEYRRMYEESRVRLFELVKEKELRLMSVVKKMGIEDDRVTVDRNTLDIMNEISNNMYRNIEAMLIKWRNFVYDTFFQGISGGIPKVDLRSNFITETGNLKIGSSLEETSELEAAMGMVSERTAYLREQGRRNNYNFCWNANPMDRRTKPVCVEATLAGVISEDEMANVHGFPPRFICRCEVVFTHEDWAEFNQGINEAIRDVRTRLIERLIDAPRQLAQYYIAGKLVIPSDPVRAAGNKMFADIEEKLAVARANEVPDFEP